MELGRLENFDERSRNFPITAALAADEPRSYTWSCKPVLDQGREGACVGFAMAHELAARPKVYKDISDSYALTLYHDAQRRDPWPGGSYPGASPKYSGSSILAGVQVLEERGLIEEYRWAFGVDDLAVAVSRIGPAVLGIPWYTGMYAPVNGELTITGKLAGGHAILCNGYNVKRREFKLHNSWGADWGKNGEAVVSYDTMSRLLEQNGEAVIPLVRKFQQKV